MQPCVGVEDRQAVTVQHGIGAGFWLGELGRAAFRLRYTPGETILIVRCVDAGCDSDQFKVVDAGDVLRLGLGLG